ncbi:MAG: rod-binding protein [Spirochaetaceae bacterium]|nr:rod-binding protein [Spirochaetaceae bacterium]MDT8299398.1 rod-binding protein [Spirochaetaceae bacterium]
MTIDPMMSGRTSYEASKSIAESDELVRRASAGDSEELRQVCEDFESLFVKMMLDSMRNTLADDTLIPKNSGEKLFEDKLYDEYAQKLSETADLGIADMMYDQLADDLPGSSVNISS